MVTQRVTKSECEGNQSFMNKDNLAQVTAHEPGGRAVKRDQREISL